MPLALVFTSAAQGLAPGRSGFCTVARHAEMPERLVALLEGLGTPHATAGTATYSLRRLEAGGRVWHVLSRFTAGGLDHTRRDNRLAHHLAFEERELAALPPPADIARRWTGWRSDWPEAASWLEPLRLQLGQGQPLIPCANWRRATGTGAKAAWLVSGETAANACLVNAGDTDALLALFAEASALLGGASWSASFTTDGSVTGADGFAWCGGETAGRRRIDLAAAAGEPAPDNEKARLASLGVAIRATGVPPLAATKPRASGGIPWPIWCVGGLLLLTLGFGLKWLSGRSPAVNPVVVQPRPRTPTPEEMAAAAAILRAETALRELEDVVNRGDLVTAARQWSEISRLSPEFTARHRDRFVPRIQAGISQAAADALFRQLRVPGVSEDPRALERLLAEARAATQTATEIGAPRDNPGWHVLRSMERNIQLLSELDIRDTWIVTGQWVTGSAGPGAPSTADFELGRETGEHVARFLREGLTGGAGTSTPVTIRLCEFRSIAQRDAASRPLRALLEPGASSLWVSEDTGGARRPGVAVSVGARANTVSINLSGPLPAGFTTTNRAVELTNPAGKRLCIALVARPEAVTPLQPGLDGLAWVEGTLATTPCDWIEPVFLRTRMAGGRMGLYPSGHEFPDRVASLSCSRNVIETDLLRQGSAGAAAPRTLAAQRRKDLEEGHPVKAGGPWTIRFVDARGQPLITLAEFR